jgi:hypothetical protein
MDIKRTPHKLGNVCECGTWIKLLTGQAHGFYSFKTPSNYTAQSSPVFYILLQAIPTFQVMENTVKKCIHRTLVLSPLTPS